MVSKKRKSDTEKNQVGGMDDGVHRYYDQNLELTVVKLMTGDCYVTDQRDEILVTILGSCVSVCMRDPVSGVGGMNHFLLPGVGGANSQGGDVEQSTRFGAFAMEELINEILKKGGKKERLETKIFGGGNVINNSAMIGTRNYEFAREFLKDEGFKVSSEDVGGDYPRRIHYFPETGKLMMRKLKRKEDMKVVDEEKEFSTKIAAKPKKPQVELF